MHAFPFLFPMVNVGERRREDSHAAMVPKAAAVIAIIIHYLLEG